MYRRFTVLVLAAAAVGCVEVPDNIRAHFAGPGPAERTNYRPGNHGSARPHAEPVVKAWVPQVNDADAGATAATTTTTSATTPNEEAKEAQQPNDAKDAGSAPQ